MKIRQLWFVLCSFAVLFSAVPAFADQAASDDWALHPGLSIGGRATYFHSQDSSAARRDWYGGAQVRLHFTHYLAAEGSADFRQEHFNNPSVTADVYPVQASLLMYLTPWARLSPFALAGVGWYFTHVTGPNGSTTQNRFGPHAGAGLQLFLSRHWSIDGTWRYTWVNDLNTQSVTNVADRHYNGNGWMATGGVNFHF